MTAALVHFIINIKVFVCCVIIRSTARKSILRVCFVASQSISDVAHFTSLFQYFRHFHYCLCHHFPQTLEGCRKCLLSKKCGLNWARWPANASLASARRFVSAGNRSPARYLKLETRNLKLRNYPKITGGDLSSSQNQKVGM